MSNPNTEDTTPVELALLPDWGEGIEYALQFATAIQRTWSGRDQRQRKRDRPIKVQRYQRSGLTAAQARARLLALKDETRQPVYAPLWPDGIQVATMLNQTTVTLDSVPYEGEWADLAKVYLWSKALGGEFRDFDSITGREITLTGTGTIYPAGAWVFPCPVQIREIDEQQLNPINLATGIERVTFRTL